MGKGGVEFKICCAGKKNALCPKTYNVKVQLGGKEGLERDSFLHIFFLHQIERRAWRRKISPSNLAGNYKLSWPKLKFFLKFYFVFFYFVFSIFSILLNLRAHERKKKGQFLSCPRVPGVKGEVLEIFHFSSNLVCRSSCHEGVYRNSGILLQDNS